MVNAPSFPAERPRVCLVAGGSATRSLIVRLLEDDGIDSVSYSSVAGMLEPDDQGRPSAKQLARIAACNLLVFDLDTAGLAALEAATTLKADARTEHLPIIVLSADTSDRMVCESIKAGAMDYITTPLDTRTFVDRVNRVLRRSGYEPAPADEEQVVIGLRDYIRKEIRRSERSRHPVSLVYGRVLEQSLTAAAERDSGSGPYERRREAVLEEAVGAVRGALRDTDTVARFGLLDFIAVLPFTGRDGCPVAGERIARAFSRACNANPRADRYIRDIRLGFASYPEAVPDAENLLAVARKAASNGSPVADVEVRDGETVSETTFCPICYTHFRRLWPKPEACRVVAQDSDLMPRYEGANPLLFEPLVCPNCRYSGLAEDYHAIPHEARRRIAALRKLLDTIAGKLDPSGGPTIAGAGRAFCLVGECYKRRGDVPAGAIGRVFHKAAWMHRLLKDGARERLLIREALRYYVAAQREGDYRGLAGGGPELVYLMGDLCQRLGDRASAARCFSQAHRLALLRQREIEQQARQGSGIAQLARRRYQDLHHRASASTPAPKGKPEVDESGQLR